MIETYTIQVTKELRILADLYNRSYTEILQAYVDQVAIEMKESLATNLLLTANDGGTV